MDTRRPEQKGVDRIGMGKSTIAQVPIEFYQKFQEDPAKAALEYMSITRGTKNPFLSNIEKIREAIRRSEGRINPIDSETYALSEGFHCKDGDKEPRYIHIDLAKNRDAVGLSMCHAPKFVSAIIQFPGEVSPRRAMVPYISFDLVARLRHREAFDEREINQKAIIEIVFNLEAKKGFNIRGGLVTFDRWQSIRSYQDLRDMGFTCDTLSIDHTTWAVVVDYDKPDSVTHLRLHKQPAAACVSFREALYQDRVDLPDGMQMFDEHETWLEKEAREATWNQETQKVVKMEGGSDDVWQTCCGAAFNCLTNASAQEVPELDKQDQAIEAAWHLGVRNDFGMSEGEQVNELGFVSDDFYKQIEGDLYEDGLE